MHSALRSVTSNATSKLRRRAVESTKRTTAHNALDNCSNRIGVLPITGLEAQAKMDKSPMFRQYVRLYSGVTDQDLVQAAIRLDYGLRLRSCLSTR